MAGFGTLEGEARLFCVLFTPLTLKDAQDCTVSLPWPSDDWIK